MFRTRGLIFRKTVVYADMVKCVVHVSVQAVLYQYIQPSSLTRTLESETYRRHQKVKIL